MVCGAPAGRLTEIWTVVVLPTKTGSVPRGPGFERCSPEESSVSVSYHGPHEPSTCRARIRAEVPVRSPPVSATMENGVGWLISRTVTPPPMPISGCCARKVSPCRAGCARCSLAAHGRMTRVAAMAVNSSDGGTARPDVTYASSGANDSTRYLSEQSDLDTARHRRVWVALVEPESYFCGAVSGGNPKPSVRSGDRRRGRRRNRSGRTMCRLRQTRQDHALEQVNGLTGAQLVGRTHHVADEPAAGCGRCAEGRIAQNRVGAAGAGVQSDRVADRKFARVRQATGT